MPETRLPALSLVSDESGDRSTSRTSFHPHADNGDGVASYADLRSTLSTALPPVRLLSPRRYTLNATAPSPSLYSLRADQSIATDATYDAGYQLSIVQPRTAKAKSVTTAPRALVTLFSARHIGLLVSLAFASVLTSCIKRGLLPLLKSELRMSQAQLDAAQVLVILPWAFSFFLGFCSDAIPLFGSHRKAYMVLGWLVASASLFALAIVNYAQEYDARRERENDDAAASPANRTRVLDWYVALLTLANFGGILSVVIAEIYVIQQSRREPLHVRGHILATFLITQFTCEMVGQLATDVVIFRVTKLGNFPLVTFQNTLFFFMVYALVPIPALLVCFDERVGDADERQAELDTDDRKSWTPTRDDDSVDFGASMVPVLGGGRGGDSSTHDDWSRPTDEDEQHFAPQSTHWWSCGVSRSLRLHTTTLYATLCRESTWRLVRFLVLFVFFAEFRLEYPLQAIERWCRLTLKTESTGKILSEAMYAVAVIAWKLWLLNLDWRVLLGSTLVGVYVLPQAAYLFLAVYDVGRSAEVFVTVEMLRGVVRGMTVAVQVALAVEITPRGSEGATLGVLVSVGTVMRLLANTFANLLGNWLATTPSLADDSGDDSTAMRRRVASLLGVCFALRLVALVGLAFLPVQKRELQALLRTDTSSRGRAFAVLATLGLPIVFVIVANAWVVTPGPACAGGGCVSPSVTTGV